jgi:uncharacterized membrane protein
MPPVCTIGIGIALGRIDLASGAALLFSANLVSIIFSATVVFLLLGVRPPQRKERQLHLQRGLIVSLVSLVIISLPLALILRTQVLQEQIAADVQSIVNDTVQSWGQETQDIELADLEVSYTFQQVVISGTVYSEEPVTDADMQSLKQDIIEKIDRDATIELRVIEINRLRSDE